ncbi:MAG TPA: DUF393 domain-containing protein [Pirellulales bacterium]|nr:DUF393 domain-containing protein [Pirellulales bacterium]
MAQTQPLAHEIEVFFDGGCPLCAREIKLLRGRDHDGKIKFTDIDAAGFQPADVGKTREELMARMHGRLPDGSLVSGVETFRRLYRALGFRRLVWLSRLPAISQSIELVYAAFARNRLRLTGRCTSATCSPYHPTISSHNDKTR